MRTNTNVFVDPTGKRRHKFQTLALATSVLLTILGLCFLSSLVVIPAHPGGAASSVARALAQVAAVHKDAPIKLISGEGADLQNASRLIIDMTTHVASGGLVIMVLESLVSNPAGIPKAFEKLEDWLRGNA